ncbi:DNA-binding response regulator, NarL/FixJ family, contains REC and HTH domains [Amycolatopsis xylanica]|uniref:DNA-binding response regulator, NarL/FixJ family, contains REC and HTH domains n=1 Tax=Amycolatopsis xylanica TaxID=589385 RepID=A0A1H3PAW8_9PSEU|nr:response regulator transcription factor [Amycolatopsis xylanica]SDY98190.1 DNA-binding response regulator, NarL/FixJ family, contains REC and HTH domains [Amycolatopsis xylanica]
MGITVGIVDDEVLFRTGVRDALERAGEFDVIGEARDGVAAVELARRHVPQVLVMNLDGLASVERIRAHTPDTRIVVLAAPHAHEQVVPALRAGAMGFLCKNGKAAELVNAVRVVAAGDAILSPAVTRSLVEHLATSSSENREHARKQIAQLSQRERSVLAHIAKGLGNVQIARALSLSEGSIKAHVSRVLGKLGCDNRVQAAMLARDAELCG